ncbi:hypothetical protein OrNV_gp032 [Oryctes rhinoceros nudivirus]|uniref:Uncharacterized protein n=1 Tax=Oryctes rhinoceros nudivirus TaxID=92521 RepID=B7SV53_9VIRU|nr:hypothetical protein OrNV_gp032 [Oryctes rhinoceros nudivirus]ACH96162.1 unknown [Oryctes rhinoceros nudivirus]
MRTHTKLYVQIDVGCVCVGEKEREFMKVEWVRTNISKSLGFETTFQVSHGFLSLKFKLVIR